MTGNLAGTSPAETTDLAARLDGLAEAADAATGRLDGSLVADARGIVDRAGARMKLSAEHTVVAIAGATGSGKSSTFNALTGLELSAVGVRRPTTSWATACVWGAEGAGELLEWLGIPDRHQTTRDSMLDTRREGNELDGVVLLDLPDHDSTEVSHHLEVDRLVVLSDMVIWVLDPQKYADAAIHDRYLEPLKSHDDVMLVVLNHIDEVPEERRESMLADLRRLLDNDGLHRVPVMPVSARLGWGIAELRSEIARRVADKKMARARLEADIRSTAGSMAEASGEGSPRSLSKARIEALDAAFADAAGVPTVVDAVRRSTLLRGTHATGWPPLSWTAGRRSDPLKRLDLDLGTAGRHLVGSPRTAVPEAASVQRSAVDAEVRRVAEEAAEGLGTPWQESVRRASVSRLGELGDRLDAALAGIDLGAKRAPGWFGLVRVVQWLLILGAVAGLVWTIAAAVGSGGLGAATQVAGAPAPVVLLVGCLVVGIVLALVCRLAVGRTADTSATAADQQLRGAVSDVSHELVVSPIEVELAAYSTVREGLSKALA